MSPRMLPAGARRVLPQGMVPVGQAYMNQHAIGADGNLPQRAPAAPHMMDPERLPLNVRQMIDQGLITPVPAWYIISCNIGGAVDNVAAGSETIRPEDFALYRVTYATTQDFPPMPPFQCAGNSVELTWSDNFTKFFGEKPVMPNALFGSSNGFLDLVQPMLFQGKQTLQVNMRRIAWPDILDVPAYVTRWDFCFHGLGLLPSGMGDVSGSLPTRR